MNKCDCIYSSLIRKNGESLPSSGRRNAWGAGEAGNGLRLPQLFGRMRTLGLWLLLRQHAGGKEQGGFRNQHGLGNAGARPGYGHVVRTAVLLVNHLEKVKLARFQVNGFG